MNILLIFLLPPLSWSVIVKKQKRLYYCEEPCIFHGTDFPGNDIQPLSSAKTLAQCKEDCLNTRDCLGMTFRSSPASECYIKSEFSMLKEDPGAVSILRDCLNKKKGKGKGRGRKKKDKTKGGDKNSLSSLAEKNNMYTGFAVNSFHLSNQKYMDIVKKHSNIITSEFELKPAQWWKGFDNYDWTLPDKIYDLTDDKIFYRQHCWIWYNGLPDWFKEKVNKGNYREVIRNMFTKVWDRYKENTVYIDVVNEILSDTQKEGEKYTLRQDDSLYPRLGPDFYKEAFRVAKEVVGDSKVKLVLLDYGNADLIGKNNWHYEKANAFYNLVKEMVDEGIPLDAVGFQLHLNQRDGPSIADNLKESFMKYEKLGLQVQICENDVAFGDFISGKFVAGKGYNDEIKERQRYTFEKVMQTCLELSSCSVVQWWSVSDNLSWLPPKSYPAMFDANYQPKDSFWSVLNVLKN